MKSGVARFQSMNKQQNGCSCKSHLACDFNPCDNEYTLEETMLGKLNSYDKYVSILPHIYENDV